VKIPYPRPTRLSDPHFDFTPESLNVLLATPDEKLEWHHLQNLLGPFLPAGTYHESVYFLPFAFQTLHCEEHALDITTSVCWFISEYADNLAKDGLLDECCSKLEHCLRHWVADFSIQHFDRNGCAAKGWGLSYFDYVHRSEAVCETLCDLDRFTRHADLADRFIAKLASSEEPVASGWFLELARRHDDVYHPPRRESFQTYFTDPTLLAHKQAIVQEHLVPAATSPNYWNDVFTKLGLEAHDGNKLA
jgi:hypothetical protein